MTTQDHITRRDFEGKGMTEERTQTAGTAQLLTMATPDGPFTVIARDGVVLASGWTADVGELTGQIHPALLPAAYESVGDLGAISAAVEAFYAGDPAPAMSVPVLQRSGPFRAHAWEVLRTVSPGAPVTYTEYAALSGNSKAVRAAASACALNAAALFVPCHRVVRTDGTLGGFRWGLRIKESLLAREKQVLAAGEPDLSP
jgi:methylated-DNA-[protein]-cysteine S-methyltransferase